MTINVLGFGVPTKIDDLKIGMYFAAYLNGGAALCLMVESREDPLCLVLDYEGDMGDDAPTPRLLDIDNFSSPVAVIPSDQLAVQPRREEGVRPFLANHDPTCPHGSLLIKSDGEPFIAVRKNGTGNWSLSTGLIGSGLSKALMYPKWEIVAVERHRTSLPLARFPEADG